MSGSIHQETKVGLGSSTRITNTYARKRGRLTNLPLNSNVKFKKGFDKGSLKSRIAQLKSSSAYKKGEQEVMNQMRRLRSGKSITLRRNNLKVKITAS